MINTQAKGGADSSFEQLHNQYDLSVDRITVAVSLMLGASVTGVALFTGASFWLALVVVIGASFSIAGRAFKGVALASVSVSALLVMGAPGATVWCIALLNTSLHRTLVPALSFLMASVALLGALSLIGTSLSSELLLPSVGMMIGLILASVGVVFGVGWKEKAQAKELTLMFSQVEENAKSDWQDLASEAELDYINQIKELQDELSEALGNKESLDESFDGLKLKMSNIATKTKSNSDSVNQVINKLDDVCKLVSQSGEQTSEANKAVHVIASSNREVVDMVSSVDEIAFQTNLLSLNASVEAARAGSSGAGFSVVATEVRNLALRSAAAAQDIRKIINESTVNIEEGLDSVRHTRKTASSIINEVTVLRETMNKVSESMIGEGEEIKEISASLLMLNDH